MDYTDQFGNKKRHSKSGFKTKKDAQIYGLKAEKELSAGLDLSADKLTVDDVFKQWKAISTLRESTLINYCGAYKNHVKPVIGNVPIKRIKYPQLQALFTDMSDQGRGIVNSARKVLKQIGILAIKSGYIESWPIDLVEITAKENHFERGDEYISLADFNRLCDLVTETKIPFNGEARRISLLLGYYAGLRISECCGLLWSDVDFDKNVLHVRHQLKCGGINSDGLQVVDILKSDSSESDVPMPKSLRAALEQWRDENPYEFVVCSVEGTLFRADSIRSEVKKKAKKMDLIFHPHMLRHTFVTNLLLSGADVKTVSTLARHKDVSVTMNVYAEVVGNSKADAISAAFDGDDAEHVEILA